MIVYSSHFDILAEEKYLMRLQKENFVQHPGIVDTQFYFEYKYFLSLSVLNKSQNFFFFFLTNLKSVEEKPFNEGKQ